MQDIAGVSTHSIGRKPASMASISSKTMPSDQNLCGTCRGWYCEVCLILPRTAQGFHEIAEAMATLPSSLRHEDSTCISLYSLQILYSSMLRRNLHLRLRAVLRMAASKSKASPLDSKVTSVEPLVSDPLQLKSKGLLIAEDLQKADEAKWLRLSKISYRDPIGRHRDWECAERQVSLEIFAVPQNPV